MIYGVVTGGLVVTGAAVVTDAVVVVVVKKGVEERPERKGEK